MIDIHWLSLLAFIAIAFCTGWAAAMIRANRQLAELDKHLNGCLAAADGLTENSAMLSKSITEAEARMAALTKGDRG